jgi:hypothetical protein
MTEIAKERGALWIAELDAIDRMTPDELRAEVRQLAAQNNLLGLIARASLMRGGQPQ